MDPSTSPEETARRVRAARALAGIRSVEALAERIDSRGLSAHTLRDIEQGHRAAAPHEIAAIAQACGLPQRWFCADWWALDRALQRGPDNEITLAVGALHQDLQSVLAAVSLLVAEGQPQSDASSRARRDRIRPVRPA